MSYRKLSDKERAASRKVRQERYRQRIRVKRYKKAGVPVEENHGVVARLVALAFKKPVKVGR